MCSLDFTVSGLIFENALYKSHKREGAIKSKPMHKGIIVTEENPVQILSVPKLPFFNLFYILFRIR